MIQLLTSLRRRQNALSNLALVALLFGAVGGGLWAASRGLAGDGRAPAGREVSRKVWVTGDEIRGRFPADRHEAFMRRAIANSRRAGVEAHTGGAFGAVIVDREGTVVAEGSNHVVSNFDPTWHGEMEAIRNACARLKVLKLDGCILYTSSEPCPMCLATAYWAGLDGVIFGATVADAKRYGGFDDAFIYEQFTRPPAARTIPQIQLLQDEAVEVWKEYAAQPGNVAY
jgi:guanine deaminase